MSTQFITAVCFLVFSILLLIVQHFVLIKKDQLLRKFVRLSTLLYITGTILVFTITIFKPDAAQTWVWLSEAFVFLIYAASTAMIGFIVKKFAEGANPAANQNPDKK